MSNAKLVAKARAFRASGNRNYLEVKLADALEKLEKEHGDLKMRVTKAMLTGTELWSLKADVMKELGPYER